MAVTKRTRFEVLRRDKHTCQYCGAKAPDATLQIDHVMPVALGGDDKPSNLVTACKDCNGGKSSIPPDSPLAQDISEKAAAYALGMIDKMTRLRALVQGFDDYREMFREAWMKWETPAGNGVKLPVDWELSLFRWHSMGVPYDLIDMAVPKAMSKRGLRGDCAEFSYMAGIVWSFIKDDEIDYSVTLETVAVYTEHEMSELRIEGYEAGIRWARQYEGGATWQETEPASV